ncbi:hypothetical protein PF010_g30881 [Phytophthora fragariae]|uniref:Uncharacterized protein n=1 Tax=Phytophthora fragariae TaxID=53985 RepID=A0A6A3GT93_9STRA|nr:hypothetical protein PF011_g30183 [Phytophthora fragariae]KAE9058754.1 hypothetical protein PF010_g30881 [Phytophthora fragariae]KAE9162535.1 hypothetical protein PF004_g30457 [Phytophthora fragariae]KAE9265602.1 hypothetical protein PF001_g30821 [Phytophthora fragariae]
MKVEMLAYVYINSPKSADVTQDLAPLHTYPEVDEHDVEVSNHEEVLVM